MEGLNHQAARRIIWMTASCGAGGEWEYPPEVAAMEAAGINPIGEYIRIRQTTIAEKLVYHSIYEICVEAERITGTSRIVRWWDQDLVNEPDE